MIFVQIYHFTLIIGFNLSNYKKRVIFDFIAFINSVTAIVTNVTIGFVNDASLLTKLNGSENEFNSFHRMGVMFQIFKAVINSNFQLY